MFLQSTIEFNHNTKRFVRLTGNAVSIGVLNVAGRNGELSMVTAIPLMEAVGVSHIILDVPVFERLGVEGYPLLLGHDSR